jgi:small subunit ribosomal protein S6
MTYELVYIIDTALEEDPRKELIARYNGMIESNGGTIDKVEEWGKRRLAYPILNKLEGYYVLVHYTAETTVPKEIERNLGITEGILRYLTTRIEIKHSNVKPRASFVANVAAAPAAAPAVEAEAELSPDTDAE